MTFAEFEERVVPFFFLFFFFVVVCFYLFVLFCLFVYFLFVFVRSLLRFCINSLPVTNGPIISVQITAEISLGVVEQLPVDSIHTEQPAIDQPVHSRHLADFKCLYLPVGFSFAHTHTHSEIGGLLTFGACRQ